MAPATHDESSDHVALVPARLGPRVLARAIDGAVVFGAAYSVTAWRVAIEKADGAEFVGFANIYVLAVFALSTLLLMLVYESGLVAWRGATPGKRLLGLQIVDQRTGGHPGFAYAVLRWLFPVMAILIPVIGILVVIAIVVSIPIDPQRRGWHDKAAATMVIASQVDR